MSEPRRVLWIIKGLGPGGAERLLVSVAEAADPAKVVYEVAYVSPWKDHLVDELTAAGVVCHLIGSSNGLADPRWIVRARRLMSRFDVVNVHSPVIASVLRPVVRTMRNRPALVTIDHNLWSSYGLATRIANRVTVALDDVHLAVSDDVRASMSGGARERTRVVVHGVPVDALTRRRSEREAQRAALGLDDESIAITTVANLRRTKDYPTLMRAAADVLERHPEAVFLAAGQGPLEQQLRDEAAALGLGERFRLLGYVEDSAGLLAASDLFVLASQVEGLPIALLEAMAMGLPVVTTDVGSTATVVTDGVNGRLVPAREPAALGAAITELVVDVGTRAAFGRANADAAREFGIERVASELEQLYAELAP